MTGFGWALAQLKDGNAVARDSWEDRDRYLWLTLDDPEFPFIRDFILQDAKEDRDLTWDGTQQDILADDWVSAGDRMERAIRQLLDELPRSG